MSQYFQAGKFEGPNRTLFAFASYNAGPGRIAQMRTEAERRGLDPNVWFNNVEVVTAEKIGMETTTYVRTSISTRRLTNCNSMSKGRRKRRASKSRQARIEAVALAVA